jgi:hypothetical protein
MCGHSAINGRAIQGATTRMGRVHVDLVIKKQMSIPEVGEEGVVKRYSARLLN